MQCLSHVYPLTRHFISEGYKAELNPDNCLGSDDAQVAREWAFLLKELWFGGKPRTECSNLKRAIDGFKEDFRGFAQHDSMELVQAMIDR